MYALLAETAFHLTSIRQSVMMLDSDGCLTKLPVSHQSIPVGRMQLSGLASQCIRTIINTLNCGHHYQICGNDHLYPFQTYGTVFNSIVILANGFVI